MRTNSAGSEEERLRAFHEKLDRPSIVAITGATSYWLEGEGGHPIGEQSATSEGPLAAALSAIERGADPVDLRLVCNAGVGDRYVVAMGVGLLWMAESAAGLPPRSRVPSAEVPPGRENVHSLSQATAGGPTLVSSTSTSRRSQRPKSR